MNKNFLVVYDYETSSVNPYTTQILSIGANIIDPRSLEKKDEFYSLLKPEDFDSIQEEALKINKLTREELQQAPESKIIFAQFVRWVQKYNRGKNVNDAYNAPIACGFNIISFDNIITRNYCKRYEIAWDDKRGDQRLFNQIHFVDLFHHMFFWTENNPDITSLKLTNIQDWMGFAKADIENAHHAMRDVEACVKIMRKLFTTQRYLTTPRPETGIPRLQMKGAFSTKQEENNEGNQSNIATV